MKRQSSMPNYLPTPTLLLPLLPQLFLEETPLVKILLKLPSSLFSDPKPTKARQQKINLPPTYLQITTQGKHLPHRLQDYFPQLKLHNLLPYLVKTISRIQGQLSQLSPKLLLLVKQLSQVR